jgi:hypothetical protein
MRVLLTNNTLNHRAGSELYLRDVALELMRRGHSPVAYSTTLGPVAAELQAATVPVIQSLDSLGEPPDIIHGQHHYETLSAMLRFPDTPAIYYCHGWIPWEEASLRFPRILRYVAVDEICRERLIAEGGIAPDRIELLFNFFDARTFPPREPLPAQPRLALAFSNTFDENSDLPILRKACAQCGIELHATGLGTGQSESNPGQRLKRYDLVFAKARSAIEAMAVGAAVVLCHSGRLGSMVTAENFPRLRPLNFGLRILDRPLEAGLLATEIQRYDAADATQVAAAVRSQCELQGVVDRLISLYESVIQEARQTPVHVSASGDHAVARYLEQHAGRYKGTELSADRGRWVERCLGSEADRGRWVERCLGSEADRDRWTSRCLSAEAERDLLRNRSSEQEQALSQALSQAKANRELAELRQQALEQLDQDWRRRFEVSNSHWRALQEQSEDAWIARNIQSTQALHALEQEIAEMRSWPAWRFTKCVVESYPMRLFMRPAVRAMRKQWRLLVAR